MKLSRNQRIGIIALALALLLMLISGTTHTGANVSPLAVNLMRPTLPGEETIVPSYAPLIGVNMSPLPEPTSRPTPP